MDSKQFQKAQDNNHAFNKVAQYLNEQGYQGPNFTTGHPLSLLAGEPIHARFDSTGSNNSARDYQVTTHNLQYAKLGFTTINGGAFISIKHSGLNDTNG